MANFPNFYEEGSIEHYFSKFDFIKDFHVQQTGNGPVTRKVLRIWIYEAHYVAHLLTEETTIQDLVKLFYGAYSVRLDIYYV